MEDMDRRLAALEATMRQLVRIGTVTSRDVSAGTVKVKLPDADGMVSDSLPVIHAKTHKDKIYFMPDIGEQVACLFLGNGLEFGVVIGAIFSGPDPVPVASGDKFHMKFADGTILEYDRAAHVLTADVQGAVSIIAKTGTVNIASGDVIAGGVSLCHHVHSGVQSGGSNTGAPVAG